MRRLALVVAVAVGCVLLGLHAQGQQPQNAFRAGSTSSSSTSRCSIGTGGR
jgi:hypothetical protein